MKKIIKLFSKGLVLIAPTTMATGTFSSCSSNKQHSDTANALKAILDNDPKLKQLVQESIALAWVKNPDVITNPVHNLDDLYDFIDYSLTCMPWNITKDKRFDDFATKCDQSILYIYYLFDQPLYELKDAGLFYPSVEYLEPIYSWLKYYNNSWRAFLDTEESWKQEYYEMLLNDPTWNLDKGWYEDPSNWHTFNQFFSRKLSGPDARPIGSPDDDMTIVSPADSLPQGRWKINSKGKFLCDPIKDEEGVEIKSSVYMSVEQMLGEAGAKYADEFKDGWLTHTYLNYDDYHRYHFPVSGTIKACYLIPNANAVGGIVYWDQTRQKYFLESDSLSWQAVETRGVVIVHNDNIGDVAVMPIGMGQVSSVNFEENVKVGKHVNKGDPLGYFLFGGSDCVMIFQNPKKVKQREYAGYEFSITVPATKDEEGYTNGYEHVMCNAAYGKIGPASN